MRVTKLAFAALLLTAQFAMAQNSTEEEKERFQLFKAGQHNAFFEITIPHTETEGFEDVIDDEIKTSTGWAEIDFGWQPWKNRISRHDNAVIKALKSIGFSAGVVMHNGADYDDFLYSYEEYVYDNEDCYDSAGYWNHRCHYCHDGYGYCRWEDVYARDTYVKYVDNSFKVGFYVPFEVAQKLTFELGANYRLFHIEEGIQTDHLRSTYEGSLSAQAKVKVFIKDRHGVLAGAEKSFSGFDFTKYSLGYVFRFNIW
jgi:hypothetical protein